MRSWYSWLPAPAPTSCQLKDWGSVTCSIMIVGWRLCSIRVFYILLCFLPCWLPPHCVHQYLGSLLYLSLVLPFVCVSLCCHSVSFRWYSCSATLVHAPEFLCLQCFYDFQCTPEVFDLVGCGCVLYFLFFLFNLFILWLSWLLLGFWVLDLWL